MRLMIASGLAIIRFSLAVAPLIVGCGSSSRQPAAQDTAVDEDHPTDVSQATLTLDTGVDQLMLGQDVTAEVIQVISATAPDAAAESIQLGRPWGVFMLHKGPRLEFLGRWQMLASLGGDYFAIVSATRNGDKYSMVSIGSAEAVPILVEREKIPRVSQALDQGRAALLQIVGQGGVRLLAYEGDMFADALETEIRVQPLAAWDPLFQVVDAGMDGIPEASIEDTDKLLPPE
jgi:hypothetical protein